MYKIARDEKADATFLLFNCLEKGFFHSLEGYEAAQKFKAPEALRFFRFECENFAKAAGKLCKFTRGKVEPEWTKRLEDFPAWVEARRKKWERVADQIKRNDFKGNPMDLLLSNM